MVHFVLYYLLTVFSGSLVMLGWYIITRGRVEYTPSGEPYKAGKIFKGWHFFWTKKKKIREYDIIEGKPLVDSFLILKNKYDFLRLGNTNKYIFFDEKYYDILKSDKELIKKMVGADDVVFGDNGRFLSLLKDKNKYVFPEWIRDPISECVTCYASFYGTLLYIVFYYGNSQLFDWCKIPFANVIFWVIYCMSCAAINTILKQNFKL